MRRVLVTGVGLVTPLGVGVEVNWRRLLRGENAVRRLASLDGMPAQIAAIVPRGDAEHEFSPMRSALSLPGDESSLSHFVQFALAASAEALAHAGWSPQTREQQERTGVAIGSGIGGLSDIIEASDALRERGVRRVSPYFIPKMLVNMAAGQVSIRAGLRGPSAAPATACATGAHALADGLRMIRSGEADVVVAGGAEACVEPLAVAGFSRVRALATSFNDAPERASRPFDASREGFVIGAPRLTRPRGCLPVARRDASLPLHMRRYSRKHPTPPSLPQARVPRCSSWRRRSTRGHVEPRAWRS